MAKLEIGVLVGLKREPEQEIRKVSDLGLKSCQVVTWDPQLYVPQVGEALMAVAERFGVTVSALWAGYPGPRVWNFTEGPKTIGLVPAEYRDLRVEALQKEFEADIAGKNVDDIKLQTDVSIIAIVGEKMKGTRGIAGKAFSALAQADVNVVAIAQGSSELNISMIVEQGDAPKAVQAIHDIFQ